MDYSQLIASLGFPIVCCIALAIYVKQITKQNRDDINKLHQERLQEAKEQAEFKAEMKEAINNNTEALNKLCETLSLERVRVNKDD